MNVLYICGAGLYSGLEKVSLSVMQGLKASGYPVAAVMSSWGVEEFAEHLRDAGIDYTRMRLGFISKTLSLRTFWMTLDQLVHLPGLWWRYRNILRRTRPDVVVHTNFHHITVLFPFIDHRRDVFYVHNCFGPSTFYRGWFRVFGPRLGRIICVSRAVADTLSNLGVPDDKLRVVRNGVKLPALDVVKYRRRNPESPVRIGIVGQIGAWKGHNVLLDALALVRINGISFRCLIFGTGDPEYRRELEAQAESLGLSEWIDWCGFVSDQSQIYSKLDVSVIPSTVPDPFPLSAIEPHAFGIPVICSNIGGLPEILEEGKTGFLTQPGDPVELAKHLSRLISDTALRERMGSAAREHAERSLAEASMVSNFAAALQNLS